MPSPLEGGVGGGLGELQPSSRARKNFGSQLHFGFFVSFGDFVWKALGSNEIFQERKDKRVEGAAEGRGHLAKVLPGSGGSKKIAGCHSRQNIPDRPDSRLISHPFFNVTPGLRTLEDYTQLCQQEDQPEPGQGHNAPKK